jgi:hypothetical protein
MIAFRIPLKKPFVSHVNVIGRASDLEQRRYIHKLPQLHVKFRLQRQCVQLFELF